MSRCEDDLPFNCCLKIKLWISYYLTKRPNSLSVYAELPHDHSLISTLAAMKSQIFTALTVNLLSLIYGISNGWIAPNILRFQEEDSAIGVINSAEAALVVSILCIGGLIGTVVFGLLIDWWGRKWTLILTAIPQIMANFLLAFGEDVYYVYTARLLLGLAGGGLFILVPVFVAEISNER